MTKVKTAVFGEASTKRRPRTSWMAKPGAGSAAGAPIPQAPPIPVFGVEPKPASPAAERAPKELRGPSEPPPSTRSSVSPEKVERLAPVIVESGPSPVEIARMRALEERERQLEQAIADIATLRQTILAESEHQLVELAIAIAKRVIARELATSPEIVLSLASEGLEALAEGDKVKVRVGASFDADEIGSFRDRVKARASQVEVVHDQKLGPDACVVETELGRVDESIESRLAAVVAHLFGRAENSDLPGKGG